MPGYEARIDEGLNPIAGSITLPSPARWKMRDNVTPSPMAVMLVVNDCKRVETFLRTYVFVFIAFSSIIFRLLCRH